MSVVRRGSVGAAVVAGVVLLGGPAWAQEDPCAPGTDGQVPLMCQGGLAPGSDTGTVGIGGEDPCDGSRPVEPGDGVVGDDDQGIAVGEPNPGAPTEPEPERVDPEQVDPATVDDTARTGEEPQPGGDGIICAFGIPGSVGAPESAAGGGVTAVPTSAGEGAAAGQLPRTGPYDRLLALTALGSGLVVVGAGAAGAGRRRRTGTA